MTKVCPSPEEVEQTWEINLSRYWVFVEKFKGSPSISRGDARAFISALTDIVAVEAGVKDVDGFKWAFGEALREAEGKKLTKADYFRTIQKWRSIDRKPLQALAESSSSKLDYPVRHKADDLTVISLFTGSYGLDMGFEYAGFKVVVALDIDPASMEILRVNRPWIPFILEDIANVPTREILRRAGLSVGEADVVIGGPPCQPF